MFKSTTAAMAAVSLFLLFLRSNGSERGPARIVDNLSW